MSNSICASVKFLINTYSYIDDPWRPALFKGSLPRQRIIPELLQISQRDSKRTLGRSRNSTGALGELYYFKYIVTLSPKMSLFLKTLIALPARLLLSGTIRFTTFPYFKREKENPFQIWFRLKMGKLFLSSLYYILYVFFP